MEGFIQLHRKIVYWEWYDDNNTFKLFIHLLLKANHKDNNYRGTIVKKGTLLTGLDTLSKETKLSIQQIRTSLKRLKSTNEITIKTSAKGSVIQIVNYEDYQTPTSKLTNSQQTTNKQLTTNNNDNNDNNDNNKRIIDFLYGLYPVRCPFSNRSLNKGKKSKDKISKLLKEYDAKEIEKRINLYIQDCMNTQTYYKAFDTFLNNIDTVITNEPIQTKRKFKIAL